MSVNKFSNSVSKQREGRPLDAKGGAATASRTSSVTNLLNLTPAEAHSELTSFMTDAGQPAYRARQILRRLWVNPAASFEEMSDLPRALRDELMKRFSIPRLEIDTDQQTSDGTRKFLFRLADGQAIETVAIPDGKRLTLCISSQAGCALQCAFCATGAMGFACNLETVEFAGQVRE